LRSSAGGAGSRIHEFAQTALAPGAFADALAGVLVAGAEAPWCGTAFRVAEEANQPDLRMQRIVDAAAEDTTNS